MTKCCDHGIEEGSKISSTPSAMLAKQVRRSTVFTYLPLLGVLLLMFAETAQASWSSPQTIVSESNPSGTSLAINSDPQQAILGDGQSMTGWTQSDGSGTKLFSRLVAGDGTPTGVPVMVADSGPQLFIADWTMTNLDSNGVLFAWVEYSFDNSSNTTALKYRSLSPNGALGNVGTLESSTIPTSQGSDQLVGLNASSGGPVATLTWGITQSRGANCSNFYSSSESCSRTSTVRVARFSADASLSLGPVDIYSQSKPANSGYCRSSRVFPSSFSELDTGSSTVLIKDNCRLQGGDPSSVVLFSRIPANSTPEAPQILRWGAFHTSASMSGDGTTVVGWPSGSFSFIPAQGNVGAPVVAVNNSGSGSTDLSPDPIALPNGKALAVWISKTASGDTLNTRVLSRVVSQSGNLGGLNELANNTTSNPASGYSVTDFYSNTAVGLGRDTGTVVIGSQTVSRANSSAPFLESGSLNALGLDRNGAKVPGSEASLASTSPATLSRFSLYSLLGVSLNGTASAVRVSRTSKGPSIGGPNAEVSFAATKLQRPSGCGVNPAQCSAKVLVKALKLSKRKLKPGAKAALRISLRNAGNADATRVKVRISSSTNKVRIPRQLNVANIAEGSTVSRKLNIKVKAGIKKGSIKVTVGRSSKKVKFTG